MGKKQHYVPQFYLRNFSESNNNMVDVYLKTHNKFVNTHVKAICQKNDFYDTEDMSWIVELLHLIKNHNKLDIDVDAKIKHNPQYIETVFLNSLEREISTIIKSLLNTTNGFELQQLEVRTKLTLFFHNLYERSNYKREQYEKFYEQRKRAYHNFPEDIKKNLFANYLNDPKEMQLKAMMNPYMHLHEFEAIITKYEWALGIADGTSKFIVSDNPAGAFFMKELCIPISTSRAILIRPTPPNQRSFYMERRNEKTVKFSKRSMFVSNTFQEATSTLLIGNRESIREHLSLVKSLKDKYY